MAMTQYSANTTRRGAGEMFHVRPYSRLSALPQEAASISAPQKNVNPFRTLAGSFMQDTSFILIHDCHDIFTIARGGRQGDGSVSRFFPPCGAGETIGPPQGETVRCVCLQVMERPAIDGFSKYYKGISVTRYAYSLLIHHGTTRDPSRLLI